ncbi:exodeoxyribonuclease VII small subunit [Halomicrobium sp. LC1Hm]|uniref:exodeoxyribonuclease VII small subunit n=1 Tax=Halomicrobium sp. LC1Hm TaxID=2610902 RepID=UPI0012984A53|nr:exodeoxyribonuclease VII small subunit [Halomicrobium sp. LC1Hm]QGA81965.1 Exonuclease VII small subunit [Halomicrobium sp. LC1Hm]
MPTPQSPSRKKPTESIIEQLEDREVSLERANTRHEEGKELLAELKEQLDVGDGDVNEHS